MLGDVQVPTNCIRYPPQLSSSEGRHIPLPAAPRTSCLGTPRHLLARLKSKQQALILNLEVEKNNSKMLSFAKLAKEYC